MSSSTSPAESSVRDETQLEYISDAVLGIAFLIVGIVAAQRWVFCHVLFMDLWTHIFFSGLGWSRQTKALNYKEESNGMRSTF